MRDRKLTGPWAGFSFKRGRLVTPEGRELLPEDLAWLGLTAALAQEYRRLLDQEKRGLQGGVRHNAEPCPVVPMLPALKRSARA
ncbi:DUF3653 domain-containing protein [Stenotrophomonas sp. LARHCG68]